MNLERTVNTFCSKSRSCGLPSNRVIGQLKSTGSTDRDVLFAAQEALLAPVKPLKMIGIWAYITDGLMTAMILMAFVGIPLIIFGWWVRTRGKENIETIEAAYAEYVKSVGVAYRTELFPQKVMA